MCECETFPVAEFVDPPLGSVVFTNVNVFDGFSDHLHEDMKVLVVDDMIEQVFSGELVGDPDHRVIDGGGRTLMPGLIDSHVHLNMMVPTAGPSGLEGTTWEEIGAYAVVHAQEYLQRGFTTLRDMGGMHDGLRRVIDRDDIAGPRLYLAGGIIGQTSGHGDWRLRSQGDANETNMARLGITRTADGRAEVLKAARLNLAGGADYLKIMVGGGVASEKDPLHSSQMTADEISAAVEVAGMWDSYVAMHVYYDRDIRRGMDCGVRCIDHGQFIELETLEEAKKNGVILSANISALDPRAFDHPVYGDPDGPQYPKMKLFVENSVHLFERINEVQPTIVFNTDLPFSKKESWRAQVDHKIGFLAAGVGNLMTLRAMTSAGGQLAEFTGENNPYPKGKIGVIEDGAYADIILVDGNPLEDISALGASMKYFDADLRGPSIDSIRLIMKGGRVYKDTLPASDGPSPVLRSRHV
jgi:imidazolonepropionase-like amidohydrolase